MFSSIARISSAMSCILVLTACSADLVPTAPPPPQASADVLTGTVIDAPLSAAIPGSYIVVFKSDSTPDATATRRLTDALLRQVGHGQLRHRYEKVLHGFNIDSVSDTLAQLLARQPAVAYVEQNGWVPATNTQSNPGVGLDRIDQRAQPLDGSFNYQYAGAGANIYILDSGVDTTGGEWARRIGFSTDCSGGSSQPFQSNDDFGHGTAVASVAAGTTYGVAKQAIMHSVRISSNQGHAAATESAIVCGLDWVGANFVRPAVVNLSYGFAPNYFSIRDAINCLIGCVGVSVVKSAGNDGIDAYQDRANRSTNEIVVGAMSPYNDTYASSSDNGPTVTIFAPGVDVPVADKFNPGQGKLGSGTSFAAPYVAGVVAAYVGYCVNSWAGAYCGPEVFFNMLHTNATTGQIQGLPVGTSNYLLYSPFAPF